MERTPHSDLRVGSDAAALDDGPSTRDACGPSVKDVPERFVKDVMELDTQRAAPPQSWLNVVA
jgi:hypothetical protein